MANKRVTFAINVPIPTNPPGPIDYVYEAKELISLSANYTDPTIGVSVNEATGTLNIPVQTPPSGQQGVAYTSTLIHVSGGVAPYAWVATSGIPTSLVLNASTGALSGTPSAAGTFAAFIVTVTDSLGATATRTFSITIAAP